jgi:multidrug efflux system membrane fusion protein
MKKLQAGEKLAVDAYDRENKVKLASGVLLTVDNQIDPTTGTVKLKAQFSNDDYSLFPNQFVNVRMLVNVKKGATVINSAAIQRGTQGTFVYVMKPDQTVTVRQIKTGPAQGDAIAIDTGIAPGELIVIDGTDKLREGAKVEPISRRAGER